MSDPPIQSLVLSRTSEANLASLVTLNEDLESCGRAAGIPDQVIMQVCLVLEELITNTVKYGYPDGREGRIAVTAALSPGILTLQVADDGDPFDPASAPEPDLDSPIDQRPAGGLGLYLIRQLADTFGYERRGGSNVVTITKRF